MYDEPDYIADRDAEIARLRAQNAELLAACEAFVEAWKHCHQLEKTDVALRMAEEAIAKAQQVETDPGTTPGSKNAPGAPERVPRGDMDEVENHQPYAGGGVKQ